MKLTILLIAACFLTPALWAAGNAKDTIAIDLGSESKIIIYVKDQAALKALQNYDFNQMLRDLNNSLDSAGEDASVVEIQDESGKKYMKDSTATVDYNSLRPFDMNGYTKEIPVARFNQVDIGHNFHLFIKKAESFKLVLAGREEDVEDIRTIIRNGRLSLTYEDPHNRRNAVNVHLEMPDLEGLWLSGATRARAVGFEPTHFTTNVSGAAKGEIALVTGSLKAKVSGAGKLHLSGRGNSLDANVSGAGNLDASDFRVESASANVTGAGKAWINAATLQSATTSGAGKLLNKQNAAAGEPFDDHVRIKVGKFEFNARTDDWEESGESLDEIDSFGEFKARIDTKEYIQQSAPKVRHNLNFDFGMNNYLENGKFPDASGANYSVRPWGSWYVGINSNHKFHVGGPVFIEWGKGVSWYNFKFENNRIRVESDENRLLFQEDPDHTDAIKSKLTASYINISLVPTLDFSRGLRRVKSYSLEGFNFTKYDKRGFRIGVGPYVGYRLGSHTKFVYRDNGREKEKDRGGFYLNNWRYGIRGQMGYKAIDFFFNYDMSELFTGTENPSLNAFSFGLIF